MTDGMTVSEAGIPELRAFRDRYVASILPTGDRDAALAQATEYAQALGPDGGWPDVDYADQTLGPWRAQPHLTRLSALACAVRLDTGGADHDVRRRACEAALDHWLAHDYQNPNWWHMEIGTPRALGDTALLLEPWLTPAQRHGVGAILARAACDGKTGQNLLWTAMIQMRHGALINDVGLVLDAVLRIADEFRVMDGPEGLQPDMSFHQHGACLYSGGYGAGFADDGALFVTVTHGTAFALPAEAEELLARYILDGIRWMVRGARFDFGVIGREISRPDHSAARFWHACQQMAGIPGRRQAELLATLKRRAQGDPAPVLGTRHFWKSEFLAHQREDWYVSVRMLSSRLENTDMPCCAGEGRRSHHISDGATCLLRSGEEYVDIYPVWNWRRIPGTTVEQSETELTEATVRSRGHRAFVGGVTDGRAGMAAMDFAREGSTLTARKSWFCFDRELVCLGAGIRCSSAHAVFTTLDQRLANGPVIIVESDGTERAVTSEPFTGPVSVWHDGFLYRIECDAAVHGRTAERTGDWLDIGVTRARPVTATVFELALDHGPAPSDAAYVYRVAPLSCLGQIELESGATVLSNEPDLQAVEHGELLLAAFYAPGRVTGCDGLWCEAGEPCLIMLRRAARGLLVHAANPRNEAATISLRFGRGRAVAAHVELDLPAGPLAGSTETRYVPLNGTGAHDA